MTRPSRVLRPASVWTSVLLTCGHALADDPAVQKAPAPTAKPVSAEANPIARSQEAPTTPEQAAAVAYQKALVSYSQGDVAGALDSMRQSFQLSKRAELLYNLAQLEEELKACSDSLADYHRYLQLVPNGRYRKEAESARMRLEKECPPKAATPSSDAVVPAAPKLAASDPQTQSSVSEPEPPSYWTPPRVIGWSAIATGALASVGAVYFTLEAKQARKEYQRSVDDAVAGGPPPDSSLEERQHHNQNLATAFWITGGALVAGGAVLVLLDPGKKEQHSPSARLYIAPGLVGAWYAQSF